jgi:hypothetical protein
MAMVHLTITLNASSLPSMFPLSDLLARTYMCIIGLLHPVLIATRF